MVNRLRAACLPGRPVHAAREGNKNLQEALNQDPAIYAEDTADNNRGDEQVEKIRVLKKVVTGWRSNVGSR